VTSNEAKFQEVSQVLAEKGVRLEWLEAEYPEIQADRLEDVVREALAWLASHFGDGMMVDDSGLFIRGLGGFPGVYSSYVFHTLGNAGILSLLDGVTDRGATFETCIGLLVGGETLVFHGEAGGSIANREQGSMGFGFDPIFVPEGSSRTFAEMTRSEKNAVSHRGRAAEALAVHMQKGA
jgi:XTP/dITP diphosphohydrolase